MKTDWIKKMVREVFKPLAFVDLDDAREPLRDLRKLLRRMTDNFSRRIPLNKPDLDILNHIIGKLPVIKKVVPAG